MTLRAIPRACRCTLALALLSLSLTLSLWVPGTQETSWHRALSLAVWLAPGTPCKHSGSSRSVSDLFKSSKQGNLMLRLTKGGRKG